VGLSLSAERRVRNRLWQLRRRRGALRQARRWAFAVQAAFVASHMSSTGNPIYQFGNQLESMRRSKMHRDGCSHARSSSCPSSSPSRASRGGGRRRLQYRVRHLECMDHIDGERTKLVAKTPSLGRPSRRWATTTCGPSSPASADASATQQNRSPRVGFRDLKYAAPRQASPLPHPPTGVPLPTCPFAGRNTTCARGRNLLCSCPRCPAKSAAFVGVGRLWGVSETH
jgi:hypothetical protein